MSAPTTPHPVERDVYDGRRFLGSYRSRRSGMGFEAFDVDGKPLGKFTTAEAANLAVIFAARNKGEAA